MKKNLIFLIAGVALFVAIAHLPYGYYQLLRFFICGVSAYAAYLNYGNKKTKWAWIFGTIAVIFNPFLKIHFEKEIWQVINFICGGIFMVYFFIKFRKGSSNK